MAANDVIQEVIENYISKVKAVYDEYDSTFGTSLSDTVINFLTSTLALYKNRSVADDLIQQFKNSTVTDTRTVTKTVTDEDGNEVEEEVEEEYERTSNTYALCYAVDKQIAELECMFVSIALLTCLDFATGEQLDNIGDILCLTRAEAALLCGDIIYFDVLVDEDYRKYLKYKAIINSNDCTYYTLMKALKAVLGDDVSVAYSEDENFPATIMLDITTSDSDDIYLQAIPPIKPAGVAVKYLTSYTAEIDIAMEAKAYFTDYASHLCGVTLCGTYPFNVEEEMRSGNTESEE